MSNLPFSKKRLGAVLLILCLAGALLVLSSLILSRVYAQDSAPEATYVSGSIATDTTWTVAGSPYYIISTVTIDSAQLTIEPGVQVIFSNKQWIHVNSGSSIVAKGTPTQHITFERSGERWRKIWFHENTSSYFRYVDLAGGGSSSSGESALIEFDGPGTHVINNCTLQNSNHQGIAALGLGLDLTIAGTLIRDNDTYSLRIDNGPTVTVTGSTFEKATNNDMVVIPSSVNVATVVITGSNFLNGATIVNQMASVTCVYAQDNWWGAADGPSGGGGGACTGVGSNSGSGSTLSSSGIDWRNYRTSVASRVGITTTPVASFTVSPDPSVAQPPGTDYTFDGSVSTDEEDYASSLEFCWDWEGDGGGCDATDMTAVHSFSTGGWHTTQLVVTDTDGLSASVTQNILSGWPPTATFVITQTSWSEFEFDASGSDDVEDDPADLEVRWDWEGDGVWDTSVYSVTDIVTHAYDHVGRYWPTVRVEDTEGVVSTLSKSVDVVPPPASSPPVSGGGMLVSADGTVTVTWASGVISDGVVITHTAWLTAPVGGDSMPGEFTYQGFTLEATFGGQPVSQTNGAYTITVGYDLDYYSDVLDLWASASLLKLYQWSEAGEEWVQVPFTVDSGQLVATTDSFGDFALVLESTQTHLPLAFYAY